MKTTVKLLALLCALMMLVSLVACGGDDKKDDKKDDSAAAGGDNSTAEPADDDNLADFEWVKFEMPEGYVDAEESDAYVTINEEADSHHKIKIFSGHLGSRTIDEYVAAEGDGDYYTIDPDTVEIGGYTWHTIRFNFNDVPSVELLTEPEEGLYLKLTIFEMEENDPAAQTVLNSLKLDTSKI